MNDDEFKMTLDNGYKDQDYDLLGDILGWLDGEKEELEWEISYSDHHTIFNQHVSSIGELLDVDIASQFNLLVMLYGNLVASIEAYLSSKFINKVNNSDRFLRKLVETDPDFSKMKFTLNEIYTQKEELNLRVATHLKNKIFHKIIEVKKMYKNVFDYDFGDIEWLIKAVELRHDCVHRAGYNKDGDKVKIDSKMVRDLMESATHFIKDIEFELSESGVIYGETETK